VVLVGTKPPLVHIVEALTQEYCFSVTKSLPRAPLDSVRTAWRRRSRQCSTCCSARLRHPSHAATTPAPFDHVRPLVWPHRCAPSPSPLLSSPHFPSSLPWQQQNTWKGENSRWVGEMRLGFRGSSKGSWSRRRGVELVAAASPLVESSRVATWPATNGRHCPFRVTAPLAYPSEGPIRRTREGGGVNGSR
jgi:hypothetical protein